MLLKEVGEWREVAFNPALYPKQNKALQYPGSNVKFYSK